MGPTKTLRLSVAATVVGAGDSPRQEANRYKEIPASTLKWVKHLTNQAFDLPFEAFLEEMDKAMQVVLVSEEHLAAREAWRERRQRRRQG